MQTRNLEIEELKGQKIFIWVCKRCKLEIFPRAVNYGVPAIALECDECDRGFILISESKTIEI